MTATFGKLQGQTLELRDGLNILCAPNEAGKSTWCAFLADMLYGLSTRERGPLADKNRYAPWSGAAMQGRMELSAQGQDITITRDTQRPNAPMGAFRAVYTGTAEPVSDLTALSCGEILTGVPREVFERSAFIRQSGMAVDQTAELEKRIVSLITTGEEDTSFTESRDRLKRQLNRRQHNKTGLIPQLRAQLETTEADLETLRHLSGQLSAYRREIAELEIREQAIREELSQLDRWAASQKWQELEEARQALESARQRFESLKSRLEEARIPGNDTIGRLRGAIVNLETLRRSVDKARDDRDEAAKAVLRVESAMLKSPFAGQTAEQARRAVQPDLSNRVPGTVAAGELGLFFLFLAAAAAVFALLYSRISTLSLPLADTLPWLLPAGAAAGIAVGGGVLSRLYRRQALEKLRRASLQKRFGTTDQAAIDALADTYLELLDQRDQAQGELNAKTSTAEALSASLTTNEQAILLEVRRFAPGAFDIPTADGVLRTCAIRRRELQEAQSALGEAQMRWDYLSRQLPQEEDTQQAAPPRRSREAAEQALEEVRRQLQERRSAADTLTGRIAALGDSAQLEARAQALEEQLTELQGQYDAIALAMEALEEANGELQSRFSPALGRRAGEIFTRLTDGKYQRVTLDRQLSAAVEAEGDAVARDACLLSQGAFDQLYLAVRLAICQTVLPPEKAVPLILDDTLTSFDDDRAAGALDYLREMSGERQILLFTCQEREARHFAGDAGVHIVRL